MKVRKYVKDFSPDRTFDCGQCFRWDKENDGSHTGIAFGKPVNISFSEEKPFEGIITIDNASEEDFELIWHNYLDLGRDYGEITRELSQKDAIMADAVKYSGGIRILNQDQWETLISFIISQNNNIPRIKKSVEALAVNFGEIAGEYRGKVFYNLPTPEALSSLTVEDLEPAKLGYRAKYLIETAKAVSEDKSEKLLKSGDMTLEEAYDYLIGLCGVGPKVANCILLFSMGKTESFPIDVWIRRVMNKLYGFEEKDMKGMKAFAEEAFGQYGGIAQQYLFYYMRWHGQKNFNKGLDNEDKRGKIYLALNQREC